MNSRPNTAWDSYLPGHKTSLRKLRLGKSLRSRWLELSLSPEHRHSRIVTIVSIFTWRAFSCSLWSLSRWHKLCDDADSFVLLAFVLLSCLRALGRLIFGSKNQPRWDITPGGEQIIPSSSKGPQIYLQLVPSCQLAYRPASCQNFPMSRSVFYRSSCQSLPICQLPFHPASCHRFPI